MKYPILKVTWADPQLVELKGLCYPQDLEGLEHSECVIVGHKVHETEKTLFIAKELWDCGAFKYVHMIPKKIIKNWELLERTSITHMEENDD